jgi:flagellar FliJ protein
MNPLQPLLALLAQTERERDAAMAEAQRAAQAHLAATAQAEQLLNYRREYEQRWGAQFRNEGKMELVNCYRGFVDRLSQAVDQQARIAQHASAQLDRARDTLLQHEVRVASVRKLIERRAKELRLSLDRIEQKQTDEFGARASWAQGLGGTGLAHAA